MANIPKLKRAMKRKKPAFNRQEHFRFPSLGKSWRKPRGINSKMRTHEKGKAAAVRVGYGMPRSLRFAHPSGYMETMVHNAMGLENIDPKKYAVRIGGTVGNRKRAEIMKKCDELKIRLLNRTVIIPKPKEKKEVAKGPDKRAKEPVATKPEERKETKKDKIRKGAASKKEEENAEMGEPANAIKPESASPEHVA